jgi:hypothetical protein|tara:strand:- start:757 stop:993 length:237 start_codon:yes stop_codon:yes gene_type:complete
MNTKTTKFDPRSDKRFWWGFDLETVSTDTRKDLEYYGNRWFILEHALIGREHCVALESAYNGDEWPDWVPVKDLVNLG